MERKLKERLAGAVILMITAVILIPVILGDSLRRTPISNVSIPVKPETNFNLGMMPKTPYYVDTPLDMPEPDNNVENPEKGVIKGMATAILENVSDDDDGDKVGIGLATENESENKLPEKEINNSAVLSAWIIQLGSFTDEKNAQALHKELKEEGFSAFIESSKKNGKTSYRVRVGPEIKRANAYMLLKKIQDSMNINGFVVRYP